jgi:ATP-dependent Lon protease
MDLESNRPEAIEAEDATTSAPQPARAAQPVPIVPEDALILVPVRNLVLFPGMILPVAIGREASVAAAQAAVKSDRPIGLVLQRQPDVESPRPEDLYQIGTVAQILRYITTPDGSHHVVCQGEGRFRVLEFLEGYPFLVARVMRFPTEVEEGKAMEARLHQLRERALEALQLLPQTPPELVQGVQGFTSAGQLADMIAGFMDLKAPEKQSVLEVIDVSARVDRVLELLGHRIEVLKLSREIESKTKATMDERQREYVLREQMRQIQKELGEGEGTAAELAELASAIDAAGMPEEIEKHARKELKRLERMPDSSTEYSMARTYLDWLVELPWKVEKPPALDIGEARKVLDEDHYGLEKVKRRIIEFLAVRKLAPEGRSPILCFVGPPGVGKTSLGRSVARAMGRKFVRMSLGGIHDEAEIRGHRRTYIGALPGRIIQNVKTAGTANPVFMLDEIDKIGMDFRGDPSSALLEVLDPEQNNTFQDNYLEVPFDLSRVLFIATGNLIDPVPSALRDRMEVIQLPGYTQMEKIEIARRFLIPKQMEHHGLKAKHIEIADEALVELVQAYTKEAGVRNLEREIANAMRKVAKLVAEGRKRKVVVDRKRLVEFLGPPRFEYGELESEDQVGAATGLVVTEVGGDVVTVEVTRMEGKEDFILTGQLGEVMRESARAGLSWTRAHASELGVDPKLFEKQTLHIHVPAGATPKDGPSAGVTMATAMISSLTGIPVRKDVAMTGEITLRGRVLPIGGLKQKILAAHLSGAKVVILPRKNEKDLREVPEEIRKQTRLVLVDTMQDVLEAALRRRPVPIKAIAPTETAKVADEVAPAAARPSFPPAEQPPVVA